VTSNDILINHSLSGIHPFQIDDEEEMLENIEHTRWNWLGDNWENVSESAKDLIRKLLEPNPAKRPDIHAALKHPWVVGETASGTDLAGAKDELKKFQARKKFKAAFKAVAATNRLKLAALSLKKSRDDAAQQHEEPVENNFIPYEEFVPKKT
jgi:serine/threonine protein kinase